MNYYEILNVKRDATQKEIRQSYKALIKKYHPDIFEGDKKEAELRSMEINAAYDVLSNVEARNEYDLSLNEAENSLETNYNSYNTSENIKQQYENFYKENSYNQYNPYSYENYKRKKSYENQNTFCSKFYDSHIKTAENYVSNKIDNLKSYQKVLIFLIFLLLTCIMILFTFIEYIKFIPSNTNKTEEEIENNYPYDFVFVNSIENNTNTFLTEEELQRKLFESIYGY